MAFICLRRFLSAAPDSSPRYCAHTEGGITPVHSVALGLRPERASAEGR